MLLQAAGATTLSTPSNELYAAMQTGACDATYTSSTSLISFRLEEVAKSLTTGLGKSYWFMLEPLVISKQIFDGLSKKEQDAVMAIGLEMEEFGTKEAMADDQKVADVYAGEACRLPYLTARPSDSRGRSRGEIRQPREPLLADRSATVGASRPGRPPSPPWVRTPPSPDQSP